MRRYALADEAVRVGQKQSFSSRKLTNAIDAVVCHKFVGPIILVGVIYLLYQLSIVQGYNLTNYTWPLLAKLKEWTGLIMPQAGFVEDPMIRAVRVPATPVRRAPVRAGRAPAARGPVRAPVVSAPTPA